MQTIQLTNQDASILSNFLDDMMSRVTMEEDLRELLTDVREQIIIMNAYQVRSGLRTKKLE